MNNVFPTVTYRRITPVGNIYVQVLEEDDQPVMILVSAAKNGSEFAAYCFSIAKLCTTILTAYGPEKGLDNILETLSDITTDRATRNSSGTMCRSGAEGIYLALLDYKRDKKVYYEDTNFESDFRPMSIRYDVD